MLAIQRVVLRVGVACLAGTGRDLVCGHHAEQQVRIGIRTPAPQDDVEIERGTALRGQRVGVNGLQFGFHADFQPHLREQFSQARGVYAVARPVHAEGQGLRTVRRVANAIAVGVLVARVVEHLFGLRRIKFIILDLVVVPHAQPIGDERQAGRAVAEQDHVNQFLLVHGVRQRQAHVAVAQGGMPCAESALFGGGTVLGIHLVEDDVRNARGERRAGHHLDVRVAFQRLHCGGGHFSDHVHLSAFESLHQHVLAFEGLEDHFVHFGRIGKMFLVRRQLDKFVLLVFHHLERTASDHRGVLEFNRVFVLPDVLWQDIQEDQLAFDVGNRFG